MNGEDESLTLAQRKIQKKQDDIGKYQSSIGLPELKNKNECPYLELTGEEISTLSPERCGEIATELASYGIYIQRTLSREKSILKWLESRIMLTIAGELNSYTGYYSHEQRRAVAIVNNAYAKEMEEMRLNSQIKVEMLEGIPFQINQLCRVLLEAQNTKRHTWADRH